MSVDDRPEGRRSHAGPSARAFALLLPPVLIATTSIAFQVGAAALGPRTGYFAAFLFYWTFWCAFVPYLLIGAEGIRAVYADRKPRLTRRPWLGLTFLAVPPVGGLATQFLPRLDFIDGALLAVVLSVALVNATLEELLWRGVYIRLFPNRLFHGWLYPGLGFALWHVAPTSVHGSPTMIVGGGLLVGLGFGWVAHRSRTIRWTTLAHFLTDATGIGFALYVLGY
jgi:uncharacterized protein